MDIKFFEQLRAREWIDDETLNKVKAHEAGKPLSVRRELLILLYFGITLLSTGLGILVYEHIDSIGHITIVLLIAAIAAACFAYCFRKADPPSWQKVESPNVWFDYVLLLGCLTLLVLIGYVQFKYQFFGQQWGLASFVPLVVLAFSAYYFDHLGVLSLAITNLAAWMGISVNLVNLTGRTIFSSERLIYSGLLLAILLLLLAALSERKNIKEHFAFTYRNFGVHVSFIALLAGMFRYDNVYFLWWLGVAAFAVYIFFQARKYASFYFLLLSVLYFYIGVSYVIVRLLAEINNFGNGSGIFYLIILYFIASAIGLVLFLINMNKNIRRHESI